MKMDPSKLTCAKICSDKLLKMLTKTWKAYAFIASL